MDLRTVMRAGRPYRVREAPGAEDWDFWAAFADRSWEPELDAILADHLTPDGVLLDIGAWIGPVTLMASRLCAHVHAVEPDPVALEHLRVNTTMSPVTVYPAAIAAADGPVRIGRRADRVLGDSMTSTLFIHDAVTVPGISAPTLLAKVTGRVDLVKMDIEGGEGTVLPAASAALHALGAPLLLSTHAMLVPNPAAYLAALDAALDGWDVTLVSGHRNVLSTLLAVPR